MQSDKADQIVIRGRCNNEHATFFVDTGSSVSLISKGFVDSLGLSDQVRETQVTLSSFTKDVIKTYGEITIGIELAETHSESRLIVTDLLDTHCLIGMDVLSNNNVSIDFKARCLRSRNGTTEFLKPVKPLKATSRVRCAGRYTVPANSVMFIRARASDCDAHQEVTHSGFIEPNYNLLENQGLLIESSMCLTDNRLLPVRVVNLTDTPVNLYKNKVLGTLYPVESNLDANIRGVAPSQKVSETVCRIQDTPQQPGSEWTKERLWTELRINDINNVTKEQKNRLKEVIWKHRKCFSTGPTDLGECTIYEGDIQLKPNYTPSWTPVRPIPYKLREELHRQIVDLEAAGVIEKCKKKSLFNSAVFLVKKPNSPGKMRFVVDMRGVNLQCLPDNYQMPLIGHVTDKIGGCKIYSTFDCSQSFHQIRYNKESRPITAFTTDNGTRYWFKRLIMGHKTSGAQFSRCMTKMMMGLPFQELIFFLDDLLLGSDDIDSHIDRLSHVFQRFEVANMRLSPAKCHFLKEQVTFCGVTINEDGIQINEERVKALTEIKPPSNRKSLQSLLGFFGYNRKWIPNYAALTKPMFHLLKKGTAFSWSPECQRNLEKLKEAAKRSVCLAIPDLKDTLSSYQLVVDGSKDGMGAHLSQIIRGQRRIIGYFSKAVPSHKRSWSQTKLELLTIFHAVEFWKVYIKGTSFRIKTDCQALLNMDTIFTTGDAMLRRKIQTLAEYDFTIEHISGASNSVADFFSRYPFKKQLKDKAVQCSISQAEQSEVNKVTFTLTHEQILQKVSELCRKQNNRKALKAQRAQGKCHPIPTLANGKEGLSTSAYNSMLITSGSDIPSENPSEIPVKIPSSTQSESLTVTLHKNAPPDLHIDEQGTKQPPASENDPLFPVGFFSKKKHRDCRTTIVETPTQIEESCICSISSDATGHHNVVSGDKTFDTSASQEELQSKLHKITPVISNLDAIKTAQDSDAILKIVKGWLQSGVKPESIQAFRAPKELVSYWKQFTLLSLEDGVVMRKWIAINNGSTENEKQLICVPEKNQERVLEMCHTSLIANHPGVKLTLDVCRRYYYWPGMANDVELFVKACVTCARVKAPQAYYKAKRQHIIAHKFNDILIIDHIEPEKLGITNSGNKYILSMTDAWSGFVVAVSTNSQNAETNISRIIHKWVLPYGVPREVISDNAPGFKAKFYRAVLTALNCKQTYGLAYECKSSSKAERTNKRLNQSLRLVLEGKNPKLWDKYLDYVCSALNSLKNRNTGYSANFLLYGRENNTPLSLLIEDDDTTDTGHLSGYAQKAYKVHQTYKDIIQKVSRNLQAHYKREDMDFNKGIRNTPFKVGELCMVLIRCPKHKFSPRWHGPIPIVKVVNDHVYVIRLPNGEKVVNISKLKRYQSNKFSKDLNPCAKEFPSTPTKNTPSNVEDPNPVTPAPEIEVSVTSGQSHLIPQQTPTNEQEQVVNSSPVSSRSCCQPTDLPSADNFSSQVVETSFGPPTGDSTPLPPDLQSRPKRNATKTSPFQIDPRQKSYAHLWH